MKTMIRMDTKAETCCEELDTEGIALIQASGLLKAGVIKAGDMVQVLNASIDTLEKWRDHFRTKVTRTVKQLKSVPCVRCNSPNPTCPNCGGHKACIACGATECECEGEYSVECLDKTGDKP